ncbi:MAG: branched-chain amino acid ABC transporter permease [Mesorhizobium sp.]|nr:MAG: branched-chain amino acid ABC transporter permease [Mesorhizobium sp.]RWM85653.1 MAG: branched-chain amino acid ABC transporter permease [Mesorhizobium sp.]TIO13922.1 MAG: branched-chain amino acid ABC transporter permease [Mesorhizobium sp.]
MPFPRSSTRRATRPCKRCRIMKHNLYDMSNEEGRAEMSANQMSSGRLSYSAASGASWVGWTVLVLVIAVAVPLLIPGRLLATVNQMLIAALFALSFNVVWQQMRLLSFGHAAFFGLGAFATIHLMRAVAAEAIFIPAPLLPVAGMLGGLVAGLIIGYFATVRTGTYFAMITLAFSELLHQIAPQWTGLFGGEAGMSSMRMPSLGLAFGSVEEVYALVVLWTLAGGLAIYYLGTTPLGRLAYALGDNEMRLQFLGYRTRHTKTLVFALSAMFSGLAGGLFAVVNENVDYTVFRASYSGLVVIHTFVGGPGIFLGPAIGASALTFFGSVTSDVTRLWPLYQGIIFIVVVMFVPQGVIGFVRDYFAQALWRTHWRQSVLGAVGVLFIAAAMVFAAELLLAISLDPLLAQGLGDGSVELWHRRWPAFGITTWLWPAAAAAIGGALIWFAAKVTDTPARRQNGEGAL